MISSISTMCCIVGALLLVLPNVLSEPIDLGIAIDVSTTMKYAVKDAKILARKLVKSFDIGADKTHVAAMAFAEDSQSIFSFNSFNDAVLDKKNLIRKINAVKARKSGPRFDLALKFANDTLFSSRHGMRKNSRKIFVILSDARLEDSKDDPTIGKAVQPLKSRGILIQIVGFKWYDLTHMLKIASEDSFIYALGRQTSDEIVKYIKEEY